MTFTDHPPPFAAAPPQAAPAAPPARAPWEQCDGCQSPVDPKQRFCVVCGAHQRRADDPAARFFSGARRPKPAAAPEKASSSRATVPALTAGILLALLPVAAGVGILVGRGATSDNEAVVEALKAQKVQVVTAGGGAATGDAAATGDSADADAKATGDDAKAEKTTTKKEILATGPTGSARKLEGSKPSKQDLAESKKAVEKINSTKGDEYVDSQRDLPDQITIP
ncbi:MAG: zinc ribbon domain-containing protein [Solirubrobacteraceae bacterium]|nr:zinc ribbon domain-containing protein [Solirubrobacteraceae bacterium]